MKIRIKKTYKQTTSKASKAKEVVKTRDEDAHNSHYVRIGKSGPELTRKGVQAGFEIVGVDELPPLKSA